MPADGRRRTGDRPDDAVAADVVTDDVVTADVVTDDVVIGA